MQKLLRPERVIVLLFYALALLLAGLVFMIFRPFLVALGWAAVLAVLCYPWTESLKRRWGSMWAATAGTAGVTVLLIVPTLLLMFLFAVEGMQTARNMQSTVAAGNFDWISRDWDAHRQQGWPDGIRLANAAARCQRPRGRLRGPAVRCFPDRCG